MNALRTLRLVALPLAVGAVLAMVPLINGPAWAVATFTGVGDDRPDQPDPSRTLVVEMSAAGTVSVRPGGDADLAELYQDGGRFDDDRTAVTAREAVHHAVPSTLSTLQGWLAGLLLVVAVVAALAPHRVARLWQLVGSAALALLVVAVSLRQQTVGALDTWMTATNVADVQTRATTGSALPIAGALLALAAAVVGALLAPADHDPPPDRLA